MLVRFVGSLALAASTKGARALISAADLRSAPGELSTASTYEPRCHLFLHFSLPLFIVGRVCKQFFGLGQKPLRERYGLFFLFAVNNHEFVHYEM